MFDTKTTEIGTFKLTRDVKNPEGDGRVKYDWKKRPVFKKGTTFRMEERATTIHIDGDSITTKFYQCSPKGQHGAVDQETPLGQALWLHLEPVQESLADMAKEIAHYHHSGLTVVAFLLETGKVTEEDVRLALTAVKDADDGALAAYDKHFR